MTNEIHVTIKKSALVSRVITETEFSQESQIRLISLAAVIVYIIIVYTWFEKDCPRET